jgi:hypothetical protein
VWQDRISEEVKKKIDIEEMAKLFHEKWQKNLSDGCPKNFAETKAMREMREIIEKKGIKNYEIVHFLHVCEVLPYSGCGCCEHRKG